MRLLQFLSRLALVCNLFFVIGVSLQLTKWFRNQDAEATVLIIGFFLAALVNPVANLCYAGVWIGNRPALASVPLWLRIANFIFLLLQILYIFHLNAQ